jgi:hypothetical protein
MAHTSETPAEAQIGTIVVDPDDIIEAMRRNKRDENEQRSHVLRVSPPFDGEHRATLHVSDEHARYPADVDPTPLHISPSAFVAGESLVLGGGPDDNRLGNYPDISQARAQWRAERDISDGDRYDDGGLTDEQLADWEAWWGVVVETWEADVRHALAEELTIAFDAHGTQTQTVAVRYEAGED